MASMPGIIGVVVIGGRPVFYLAIGLISAALFLIGYVIAAAGKDQPFRRVYVLLYLILNRASAPVCPHLIHHRVSRSRRRSALTAIPAAMMEV